MNYSPAKSGNSQSGNKGIAIESIAVLKS